MVGEGHHEVLPSLIVVRVRSCGIDGASVGDRCGLVELDGIRPGTCRGVPNLRQNLVVHPVVCGESASRKPRRVQPLLTTINEHEAAIVI